MQSSFEYVGVNPRISEARRTRIQRACIACRRRKIKCNGNLYGCAHCHEKEQVCRYEAVSDFEKLKARSYKRQLNHRRTQTQIVWEVRPYGSPLIVSGSPSSSEQLQQAPKHASYQPHALGSPFSSPSMPSKRRLETDNNPYFNNLASTSYDHVSLPSTSSTSSSSLPTSVDSSSSSSSWQQNTPILACSSSLSSPTFSVSSPPTALLTPMSDCFPMSISAPQLHSPAVLASGPSAAAIAISRAAAAQNMRNFSGGLELYVVPTYMSTPGHNHNHSHNNINNISNTNLMAEMSLGASASSASSNPTSCFSSPDKMSVPLPTYSFSSASGLINVPSPPIRDSSRPQMLTSTLDNAGLVHQFPPFMTSPQYQ